MAQYLIVHDSGFAPVELTEAKNLKAAVADYPNPSHEDLIVYRIASGPTKVRVKLETVTTYDVVDGGSWDTEEE